MDQHQSRHETHRHPNSVTFLTISLGRNCIRYNNIDTSTDKDKDMEWTDRHTNENNADKLEEKDKD